LTHPDLEELEREARTIELQTASAVFPPDLALVKFARLTLAALIFIIKELREARKAPSRKRPEDS
jgi:glyoxylate carboligase